MRIRKVELQGFKSFVDRQSFHFGEGIAGVVGPNGCGKSNISDAIRWCIGEMSAKSLRGSDMQDVIFNGTSDRKPVGMAEVGMTFLADGEPFPGQWARYEEIQVTRRLYRSGQSEYLINQEKVRRRDIQDLFLDTGISNPLYSFIEQGRVETLIASKPEKRRELIEEAAGISRYKVRRAESLSKLDKTEQNLLRTTDLTDEMTKRLRSLEKQVQKAAKYRRLRAWVRQGELFLSLAKFNGLTGDRKALFGAMREAKQRAENESREVLRKEKELGLERDELLVIEAVVGKIRDDLSEMEATRREQESAKHYQKREQDDLVARIEAICLSMGRLRDQLIQSETEKKGLGVTLSEARQELLQQEDRIAWATGEAGSKVERLEAHRSQDDKLDRRLVELISTVATAEANLQSIELKQESIEERLEEMDAEGSQAAEAMGLLEGALSEGRASLAAAEQLSQEASTSLSDLLADQVRAEAEREAVEQLFRQARKEVGEQALVVARTESRLHSLEELHQAHAGVSDGAKKYLDHPLSLGTVAEHLDVDAEDESLVQALLGELLNCVLVENDTALEQLLAEVQCEERVMVLSLERTPPPGELAKRFRGSATGEAALAVLLQYWTTAASLEEAVGELSMNVLLDDGRVRSREGVLCIGEEGSTASTAILRRGREIVRLQQELAAHRDDLQKKELKTAEINVSRESELERRTELNQKVEAARLRRRECDLALAEARHSLTQQEGELLHRKTAQKNVAEKLQRLNEARQACQAEAKDIQKSLAESRAMCSAAKQALDEHRLLGTDLQGAASQAREALARSESDRKGAADRVDLLKSTYEGLENRIGDMNQQMSDLRGEEEKAKARVQVLQSDDLRLADSIAELESQQGVLREKIGTEGGRLKVARERMSELEERLRLLRGRREEAQARVSQFEMELQEVRVRIESVREQVQQRYQLSLAALLDQIDREGHYVVEAGEQATADLPIDESKLPEVQDFSVRLRMLENESLITEWVERVQDSRKKVEMLGEVNLAALEEFVELRARHIYLEEQRLDLEESVASIRRAIAQINRTCRERFRDAYDKVDANFQLLYPRLVGGGSARLQLTNEDDLLETGVEILAQPPGKRLQNLSLLSGGEKAMTALALIFSLFLVKPSPFCLLDEVDAPLDDSNGARFNQMLREMSERSQFIVITHNKKTMEVMDTLYGVTMPKPGQSRLVSVQVH